eukprot:jgi/Tetstr1/457514/TSEL_044095.t1
MSRSLRPAARIRRGPVPRGPASLPAVARAAEQVPALSPVAGAAAWLAADLRDAADQWLHVLNAAEVAEILAAVESVDAQGLETEQVTQATFPLPTLGPKLLRMQEKVVNGRGFVLLRGLPVEDISVRAAANAYWGIGRYFGEPVPQNKSGHLLGHVCDLGLDASNPNHRVYATSAAQPFHTDSADIVGLLCLREAMEGGLSSWCSSVSIYNEMLRRRPDLVHELMSDWYVDRKGEIPPGKGPYYRMPVFHMHEGVLSVIYARGFIQAAQRHSDVPRLTPQQVEALDMVDELAASDLLRLDHQLQPGDIQILHNHQLLHARSAFKDWPDGGPKRHLLRLWLSPKNGRPLPPVFEERYSSVEPGNRGGIRCPGVQPFITLKPSA